jgi:hypothetical protein
MKRHILSALATAAMLAATAAQAGPVIIDGTDSADHGTVSGTTNLLGWEYMQGALTNLGTSVTPSAAKVVQVIGADSATQSRVAIASAFARSSLVASGWIIQYVSGAAAINAFMGTFSTANTGILYLSTAGLVAGDLDSTELAAVNGNAANINAFVSNAGNPSQGGALFAQGETGIGEFGWLSTLIPGIANTDIGGGGLADISLTPAGAAAFPGLTNADLAGAGNWHEFFTGNLGGLSVLGTAPDQAGVTRNLILGGGVGTFLQCGVADAPACPMPEPGSMVLVATAGFALLGLRRRRQSK